MPLSFYMDHHVPKAITLGLRLRGIQVLTAEEDGAKEKGDPALLDRAGEVGYILFTRDKDLLIEASRRQRANEFFVGVVYAHQLRVSIGRCIHDLEIIAKVSESDELANQVFYLPL